MALLSRAALGALVLLAGCTRGSVPTGYTDESRGVHAVLEAGAERASVLVLRFSPEMDRAAPLSGAVVELSGEGRTVRLTEQPDAGRCFGMRGGEPPAGRGCYAGEVPGGIGAGERWTLEVRFPDGRTATGSTDVPLPVRLTAPAGAVRAAVRNRGEIRTDPATGQAEVLGEVPLAWDAPAGTARVEVALAIGAVFAGGVRVDGASCRTRISPPPDADAVELRVDALRIYEVACRAGPAVDAPPLAWDSIAGALVVTAYDAAYARYVERVVGGDAVRPGHASAGLSGAFGLFAGAAPVRRAAVLISESD